MEKSANYFFLANGGKSAELFRKTDWSATELGSPEFWPHSLKITLATIFSSQLPMSLFWSDDLFQFYNSEYLPLLHSDKNAVEAIGLKVNKSSGDSELQALIHEVMTNGTSLTKKDKLFTTMENGISHDTYWTINYTPIYDDNQKINGVLAIFSESLPTLKIFKDLEKTRAEFEFAVEAAELGTFDLNAITNQFSANNRLKNWFGLEADDHIPLEIAINCIAEFDRERVTTAIRSAMSYHDNSEYELEYTIVNSKSNEKRLVYAKGRADFNELNQATRLSGTLQDITAYRKADEEIRKARALTDLTIKNMGIGVFTIDTITGSIEYTPEFATIITGSKEGVIDANGLKSYLHPEDVFMLQLAVDAGSTSGNIYFKPRIVWPDGSVHLVAFSAAKLFDNEGKATLFSGIVEDITKKEINRIALEEADSRLEQTKQEASLMFKNVTDGSPTGLWLSNSEGKLTYLNKTLVDWTGLSYDDLLMDGWAMAILEEDRELAFKIFSDCIKNKSHYDILFRIKKFDNDIIWVRSAGDPFYDENGEFVGYAGFCMDMDEIILGRKALADSEERFSLMIEQSPLAISLFTGFDMKIEIVNDAMLLYWGRDRSIIGKNLYDAMPELIGQPFLKLLQEVYTTGEPFHATEAPAQIEVNGVLQSFYFDYNYQPIRDSKGKIYGVMNVANDVTEQVLSTQKLLETRIALSGAIELAELATWKISVKSEEISFSDRFKFWLGLQTNNVAQSAFLNLISNDDRDAVRDAITNAIAVNSVGDFDIEFAILNDVTSQLRIIHASAKVFYDADGNADYLSGTAQDVTKEKKLQEELKFKVKERTAELRKANTELEINNQELQQFAYIASHDLQEPVRKITVFMQMLESFLETNPEKVKVYIDKINSSTKRMTDLIRDVLGFSELAKTARAFEKTDLNQVVRHILNDFDLIIEQREAKVTYSNLPIIDAIPLQMSQLFGNLISNALKYSKADVAPIIQISGADLSEKEKHSFDIDHNVDYFKIEITDNGIGFDQKYSDQIFNIFQRLHGKDEFAGTGIGLAMCRKILQNHNGEVVAKSALGIGTVFTVIIPKKRLEN